MTDTAKKIVVGVDGSEPSIAALQWAERYAVQTGDDLEIVGVWEWPFAYGYALPFEGIDLAKDTQTVLDKAVASLTALPPDRVRTRVLRGNARDQLVKASSDAALLVVGAQGHSALATLMLGSVSAYVVAHAAVPVVIVR